MAQTSFTRAEAQAKVGKRVRTHVACAGVPRGAIDTIIRADRVIDGYDVEVAWVWSGRRTPWLDWLTKEEYEARLIEMRESRGCMPPAACSDEVQAGERAKPRSRRASRPMREA
jgi:hypothetical protein